MIRDCSWLPHAKLTSNLPADTRGKARVDDRGVISGIVHVLETGGR